jgi:hypothetical protein
MNTEQAFVEGFVKRAMEYGFSQNESLELLKEAARGAGALSLIMRRQLKNTPKAQKTKEIRDVANKLVKDKNMDIPARHSSDAKGLADELKLLRKHN